MIARLLILAAIGLATFIGVASAHDSRPLVVTVKENGASATIDWRAPPTVDAGNAPVVRLAPPCQERRPSAPGLTGRVAYDCPDGVTSVSIAYGYFNPSLSTILRFERRGAPAETTMLPPDALQWTPAPTPQLATVAGSYFKLGVHHIVVGVDHILFLCGLLILAGTLPRMLLTVTGFTLAHSVTLALVALGVLQVSVPAVE
ncbi:MAG: HupE/UreJ family protein, partial [Parvularculaceae bacterium]|nr:HupE/UreJ family protein [Parvularculaceae bacterium]